MKHPQVYAYAQVRIQAGLSRLPPPAYWHGLSSIRTLPGLFQKLQSTGLAAWIDHLNADSTALEVEEALRRRMCRAIMQTAQWAPPVWQPAVMDLVCLPYLPLLDAYWRGQLPAVAIAADFKEILDHPARIARLLEQLHTQLDADRARNLRGIWLEIWQPLWAGLPGSEAVSDLVQSVAVHLEQFRRLPGHEAWPYREQLWSQGVLTLRRGAFAPVALFAWLLLVALTIEQLRAAWLDRLLFSRQETP